MSILRKISTVAIGTACAQLVAALSIPLLTRLFPPTALAGWAVFNGLSAIFGAVATLRLELAIVLPRERTMSAALYVAALGPVVAISGLAALVLWMGSHLVLPPEWQGWIPLWCSLLPMAVAAAAVHQLSLAWCVREGDFTAYAVGQIGLPMLTLLAQLAAALSGGRNSGGIIIGTVAGQVSVGLVWSLVLHLRHDFWRAAPCSLAVLKNAVANYRNYPLFMTPSTLLSMGRERLALFLLGRLGSEAAAGYYAMAARVLNLPNSFVASAVRPAFFRFAAEKSPAVIETQVRETVGFLGVVTILFWAPCAVHVRWLTQFIFGPNWGPVAPYALALSIPVLPLTMGNWADRLFDVLGRQRTALGLEMIFSTIAMAGLLSGYWIFRNLLAAIWVQSILLTVYYVLWLFVLFQRAGYAAGPLVREIAKVALCGGLALGAAALERRFLEPWLALMLALVGAVAVAAAYARRFLRQLAAATHVNHNQD
jgi:O-antigen/teichoic acid export membrane protein